MEQSFTRAPLKCMSRKSTCRKPYPPAGCCSSYPALGIDVSTVFCAPMREQLVGGEYQLNRIVHDAIPVFGWPLPAWPSSGA
jgi:hypothetical protein